MARVVQRPQRLNWWLGLLLSFTSIGEGDARRKPRSQATAATAPTPSKPAVRPPVQHYGDPAARTEHSELATRIEALAVEQATQRNLRVPTFEPRLAAALALMANVPGSEAGRAPPPELISEALWWVGLVEPLPYLIAIQFSTRGGEAQMLSELRPRLGEALASGRFRRVAAHVEAGATLTQVLVALQESSIALDRVPRQLRMGQRLTLSGRLLDGVRDPELSLALPGGEVRALVPVVLGDRFTAPFVCLRNGRYQVEVLANGEHGSTVLANFPIYCGVPTPQGLAVPPPSVGETPWQDAAHAEAQLYELLTRDRQQRDLPPLELDPKLTEIARAHSEDMRAHGFVGHTSPATGSPADRVARAGLPPPKLLLENVGAGSSPAQVERGFLDSPAHRANLLNADVTQVGIGAAVHTDDIGRTLLVTQLFALQPRILSTEEATLRLRQRIDELRRAQRLAPLQAEERLSRLARAAAEKLAQGSSSLADADQTLAGLNNEEWAPQFKSLRGVLLQTSDVETVRLPDSLRDAELTHAGVAVTRGGVTGAYHGVLVLGVAR